MAFTPYTETSFQGGIRKRIPLRDAFIEAFPEETPILSMITKETGKRTVSPDSNTSEVEWFWKTFRKPRNRPVNDGVDIQSVEFENNDPNKFNLKGRLQLIRSAVGIGRIAESVVQDYGDGAKPSRFKDNMKDALRGMRADKEMILCSNADTRGQSSSPVVTAYQNRGFGGWMTNATLPDLPIPTAAMVPANSLARLGGNLALWTEPALRGLLQSAWDVRKTKAKWKMFNTSTLQTLMDDWLVFGADSISQEPIRRMNMDASTSTIKLSVKSFIGSFGQVDMTPKHDLPASFTDATVVTTSSSATLAVADNSKYTAGMAISGAGIPANTYILAVTPFSTSTTVVVMSANATASATITATVDTNVYGELWDLEFASLGYVDEVGWADLENKGGGPRGYADALFFLAMLNPQAHAIVTD